jgi:hypothetical protein
VIDNRRIALNDSVHGKVASIAGVGDLSVFKQLDGSFYGIYRSATILHDAHGDGGGAVTC